MDQKLKPKRIPHSVVADMSSKRGIIKLDAVTVVTGLFGYRLWRERLKLIKYTKGRVTRIQNFTLPTL
jgi:hypothetical protein